MYIAWIQSFLVLISIVRFHSEYRQLFSSTEKFLFILMRIVDEQKVTLHTTNLVVVSTTSNETVCVRCNETLREKSLIRYDRMFQKHIIVHFPRFVGKQQFDES